MVATLNGHTMTGGDGLGSYSRNSDYQRSIIDAAKLHIQRAVAENLQPENFTTLETFSIADLGCSVGPNTFFAVQNILDSVKLKYKTHEPNTKIPEFHVFFNDHSLNDFNTLFKCLPSNREYYASGVPGSFYSRLFLRASVHFVHSSYSLQWLSQVPKEVININSPAWNKGKIYHTREEVTKAYSSQHAVDMASFLCARADEVVPGGLVAIVIPARPNGIPHAQLRMNMLFDLFGSCLLELSNKGLINEEKVDLFNIPIYCTSPQELEAVIQQNGCFSIESMESLPIVTAPDTGFQDASMRLRVITEELIKEHFGPEILDELFNLFTNKLAEAHQDSALGTIFNLFLLLKRETYTNS
ncbi:S-adenosyl-L-methionine-dependent methyltransferase superfamily protein [Forsythia ovata]|uniref:S-adenosyl-L-methionine-dependent methyltransferase superfamily protein n=1 Tax=Forsythia ovata TaxID=205694 RepID=A0ABD1QRT1_9LAMI